MRNGRTMEDNDHRDDPPWKNIEPLGPVREVVELRPVERKPAEESRVALDVSDLQKHLDDPLYHLAAALRALTWEQMDEFTAGSHTDAKKLIAWARVKQGEPEVISPSKPADRRV